MENISRKMHLCGFARLLRISGRKQLQWMCILDKKLHAFSEGLADFLIRLPQEKQIYKQGGDVMISLVGKGGLTILDLLQLEGYEVVTMLAPGFGGTAADSRREVLLRKVGSGASLEGKSDAARI